MKVFRVFNGFTGFSSVHRIVLAESPEDAVAKATRAGFNIHTGLRGETTVCELVAEEVSLVDDVEGADYD